MRVYYLITVDTVGPPQEVLGLNVEPRTLQ